MRRASCVSAQAATCAPISGMPLQSLDDLDRRRVARIDLNDPARSSSHDQIDANQPAQLESLREQRCRCASSCSAMSPLIGERCQSSRRTARLAAVASPTSCRVTPSSSRIVAATTTKIAAAGSPGTIDAETRPARCSARSSAVCAVEPPDAGAAAAAIRLAEPRTIERQARRPMRRVSGNATPASRAAPSASLSGSRTSRSAAPRLPSSGRIAAMRSTSSG